MMFVQNQMSLFLLMIKIGLINSSNFNCTMQYVACMEFTSIRPQTFPFSLLGRAGFCLVVVVFVGMVQRNDQDGLTSLPVFNS